MLIHLRHRTRVQLFIALVTSIFLYLSCVSPSLRLSNQFYKVWHGPQRRIIVFGDSFSDTNVYVVDPPDDDLSLVRDPDEGKRWTEVLCDELLCDSLENFARTSPATGNRPRRGAVICNDVFRDATLKSNVSNFRNIELLPDLRVQVQQWISYEDSKAFRDLDVEDDIIFTVFFGMWDMWQYAMLDHTAALAAISATVLWLFRQLDIIVEHSPSPPRIVVPSLWDITFTPRFRRELTKKEMDAFYGEQGHKMVYLIKYWNTELINLARTWSNGKLYVLDLDDWVAEIIRTQQLFDLGLAQANINDNQLPEFIDVSNPCLHVTRTSSDKATLTNPCEYPEQYLFW